MDCTAVPKTCNLKIITIYCACHNTSTLTAPAVVRLGHVWVIPDGASAPHMPQNLEGGQGVRTCRASLLSYLPLVLCIWIAALPTRYTHLLQVTAPRPTSHHQLGQFCPAPCAPCRLLPPPNRPFSRIVPFAEKGSIELHSSLIRPSDEHLPPTIRHMLYQLPPGCRLFLSRLPRSALAFRGMPTYTWL